MGTPEQRRAADRSGLRYPSDLTDAEWSIVEPMIPPARHGGRKRSVNVREVLNGTFYILWTVSDKEISSIARPVIDESIVM
ncbi:IS5 family transposase [Nitrobacter sp. TKz-YC01]